MIGIVGGHSEQKQVPVARPSKSHTVYMEQLLSIVTICCFQEIPSLMHILLRSNQFLFTMIKMIELVIDYLFAIKKLRDVILFMIRNLGKEIYLNDYICC